MVVCDICGFEHKNDLQLVIQEGLDGILRCKICRHKLMYGRYIHSEIEEFELFDGGCFTDEYKRLISIEEG